MTGNWEPENPVPILNDFCPRFLRPATERKGIDTIFNQKALGLSCEKANKDFNSLFVLLLTVSIFFPYYVSVAAIIIIAFMTVVNYEKRAEAFRDPYSIWIVLFFVFTALVGQVYNNHIGTLYSIFTAAILTASFYIRSFMTRQLFNNVMDTACFCSVACAVVAILQKVSTFAANPSYRPTSTFLNANYYGMMIEFVVLIAMYRMFTNAQNRNYYLMVIAFNLVGLYLSASMSAVMALACAVAVMLLCRGRYRVVAALCALGAVVVAASFLFPEIFPRVALIDQSWEQRLDIWRTAVKGIRHHPMFGQGAMAYQLACNEFFGYKTYHAHSLYLDTLLNYGFVGAGAIAFYLAAQVKILILRFRNNICTNMNVLLVAVGTAILIHGFTDVTIFWVQTALMFLLVFSSTGINSEYVSLHMRQRMVLLPDYRVHTGAAYFKN